MVKPNDPEQVYNERVIRDDIEKCWLWSGSHNSAGYATVWIKGKLRKVSHIALEIHGVRRKGTGRARCALHNCDNPGCVNPRHLRWGTLAENAADKVKRGRCYNGDPALRSGFKRTPQMVNAVLASDLGSTTLARVLGISKPTILRIREDNGIYRSKVGPRPIAQERVMAFLKSAAVDGVAEIGINELASRLSMHAPNVARALSLLKAQRQISVVGRTEQRVNRYLIA